MSGKKPKPAAKKPSAKKPAAKAAKKPAAKRRAKPKKVTAYVVVREVPTEVKGYTEPTTVFATKAAAAAHAAALNAELRAVCNPFERYSPEYVMKDDGKALLKRVEQVGAPKPVKPPGGYGLDWQKWWDDAYFDMTDAQRVAIWDALPKFPWFEVQPVTVEG